MTINLDPTQAAQQLVHNPFYTRLSPKQTRIVLFWQNDGAIFFLTQEYARFK